MRVAAGCAAVVAVVTFWIALNLHAPRGDAQTLAKCAAIKLESRKEGILEEDQQRFAELTRSITADRASLRAHGCAERGEAGRPPPKVARAGTPVPEAAPPKSPTTNGAVHWVGTWTGSIGTVGHPGTMTIVISGNNQSFTLVRDVRWSDGLNSSNQTLTCQVGPPKPGNSGNSRATTISTAICGPGPPPWSFALQQWYYYLSDGTLDAGPSQLLRRVN